MFLDFLLTNDELVKSLLGWASRRSPSRAKSCRWSKSCPGDLQVLFVMTDNFAPQFEKIISFFLNVADNVFEILTACKIIFLPSLALTLT